jgi:hypothetical protein
MPGSKTDDKTDDKDKFIIINEDGNSEEDETQTPPPPEDPPLQTIIETTTPNDIFEPTSREVSMVTTAKQPKTVQTFKSLIFGFLFCCRPYEAPRTLNQDTSEAKKKGLRYENS